MRPNHTLGAATMAVPTNRSDAGRTGLLARPVDPARQRRAGLAVLNGKFAAIGG